jgi:hypothetical protein
VKKQHLVLWRAAELLLCNERSRSYARFCGCSLEVTTTSSGQTVAVVERKRAEDGGWETIVRNVWDNQLVGTVAGARIWCEAAARLHKATMNVLERPRAVGISR